MIAGVISPSIPRAIFKAAQVRKNVAGRELLGLTVEQEEITNVPEDLNLIAVLCDAKSSGKSGAGPGRPLATNHVGYAEEGFGTFLLAGSEGRGKLNGFADGLLDPGSDLGGPVFKPLAESFGEREQVIGREGLDLIGESLAPKNNGDTAGSEGCRQESVAGEGLGADHEIVVPAMRIAGIYVRVGPIVGAVTAVMP